MRVRNLRLSPVHRKRHRALPVLHGCWRQVVDRRSDRRHEAVFKGDPAPDFAPAEREKLMAFKTSENAALLNRLC